MTQRKDKYNKASVRLPAMLAIGCLLVAAAVLLVIFGNRSGKASSKKEPAQTTQALTTSQQELTTPALTQPAWPQLLLLEQSRQGEKILVSTSFAQVSYSASFSDIVTVECYSQGDARSIRFFAQLSGSPRELFEICFDGSGTIDLGTLQVADRTCLVTARLFQPPEEMTDNDRLSFLAAQDVFNEVVVSMGAIPGFAPAG